MDHSHLWRSEKDNLSESASLDDDQQLWRAIDAGNLDALHTLYARYARPVFSLAMRILPTTRAAETVLEDVFVHLWTMPPPEVTTGEAVGSWLLTITRQLALTWNEQTQNLGGYPTNQRDNDDHGDPRSTTTGHSREVIPTTNGHSFIDMWAALPAIERHALELAYFHQRRPQQIADEMHVPVDMITEYIRRTMNLLKATDLPNNALSPPSTIAPAELHERSVGNTSPILPNRPPQ